MIKRRGTAWQVDFRYQDQRVRKGVTSQEEGLRWEAWARGRLAAGLPLEEVTQVASDGWTLDKLIAATAARFWKGTPNGEEALRLAEHAATHFGGSCHPKEITSTRVDAWVQSLQAAGNSPATVNRKLSALGKCLRFGVSRGVIDRMPSMERAKESEGRLRWYTHEEEATILAGIEDPLVESFVVCLLDSGGRLGEVLAVQVQDVKAGVIHFQKTKNGRGRGVPMTSRLSKVIEDRVWALKGSSPTTPIWSPLTEARVREGWDRGRRAAGLAKDEQAVLHTCRHTCASRLVQAGVPIQVVQQWLGHRTLTMTLRYAHLAPANIAQAASALDKVVRPVTIASDIVRSVAGTGGVVTPVTNSVQDVA